MRRHSYRFGLPIAAALAAMGPALFAHAQDAPAHHAWPFIGNDLRNTRSADDEHAIGVHNVGQLQPAWSTSLKGASSVTPVSDGPSLYIPTDLGHMYRINRKDGKILWEVELGEVLGIPGAATKGAAVTTDALIFGTQKVPVVAAIDKNTGALLWKTTIDDHPRASISQPPIIVDDRVFIGVVGVGEEAGATFPDYKCCSFRGSVSALDARTGKVLWKTYTVPQGFAGGSVWSRTPSFDVKRNLLYITTGNMYQAPSDVQACADKNKDNQTALKKCYPPGVWNDSILALDPVTGAVKWGFRGDDYDIFTGACQVPEKGAKNCGGGGDFDFGNGAMLWHAKGPNGGRDLLGAGEKSGVFWALDRDSGKVVWQTRVGPGGVNGGMMEASATDGARVYTALADSKQVNRYPLPYTLPSGQTIKYGSFAALDAATGKILWQIADPAGAKFPGNDNHCGIDSPKEDCGGAFPKGPVSVANGVMYACSTTPDGPMFAFDASSGAVLWTFNSGSSYRAGASIIDGTVYWMAARTLNAFSVPTGNLSH